MIATERRGRFLTFEGGEGVGKSTQARRLAARLRARGLDVVETREPGGSPRAETLRGVLLSGAAKPFGAFAETVLIAAARADHVDAVIRPALACGSWVLCDRFTDSTRCYQGALGGVPQDLLDALDRVSTGDVVPDLTFVLDAPATLGLGRARKRADGATPDRFEGEDAAFHERLRLAFVEIARAEPERCVLIDARGDPEIVAERLWEVVERRWPQHKGAP